MCSYWRLSRVSLLYIYEDIYDSYYPHGAIAKRLLATQNTPKDQLFATTVLMSSLLRRRETEQQQHFLSFAIPTTALQENRFISSLVNSQEQSKPH
jgi:hypothetical protein